MRMKKVACYFCGGHIEYDLHSNIQGCSCPHCNRDILLSACNILPTHNTRYKLTWATISIVISAILIGGVILFGKKTTSVAASISSVQPVQSVSPELPVFPKNILLLPDFRGTNVVLIPHERPSKKESDACNKILIELLMINKSLEIGTSYNRFAQLIQDQALAVERIKLTEQVPIDFSFHAEKVVESYRRSLDCWNSAIEANGRSESAYESLRSWFWASADIHFEYMRAILGNSDSSTIIERYVKNIERSKMYNVVDAVWNDERVPTAAEILNEMEIIRKNLYASYNSAQVGTSGDFHE